MSKDILSLGIEAVKGVGAKRAGVLREAGIHELGDLFYYLPRRYLDRTETLAMASAPVGQEVTLIGRVRQMSFIPGRRPRFVLIVEDETEDITCTFFQGGRYLQRNFEEGDEVALSGKVDLFQGRRQMVHPEYEFIRTGEENLLHTSGIVPLYTSSADMKERGLRSRGFRRLVHGALEAFVGQIRDDLPLEMRQRLGLGELGDSLRMVHFPASMDEVHAARRRLAFGELFTLQERLARLRKKRREESDGIVCKASKQLVPELLNSLPFALTDAQRRVVAEIATDMQSPRIMNRLVQGDVGSGKTLVGLCAMLETVESGYQAAMMAPTEILAEQHYFNIRELVEPLGLTVVLLKGGQRKALRQELLTAIESGGADMVVGTHALIQKEVKFARLGLVVVDEQHRFGVVQRSALYKKGERPDLLVMTATPIPRTLALTLYGELEVSVLDELPPGRKQIRTALRNEDRRAAIFEFVGDQVRQGRQAYVVYPLIEESEKIDLKSANEAYEELCGGPLSEFAVALLHGRLAAEDKARIMQDFAANRIQVLVSTTVIEVGVDVPNATVMVIEHAERFGMAQLHQLRGRVGRGGEQSYCILINYARAGVELTDSHKRLETIAQTQDGFAIAEQDLRLRGPGEFFGTQQAGLPEFKAASLVTDEDLLQAAREEAERIVASEVAD